MEGDCNVYALIAESAPIMRMVFYPAMKIRDVMDKSWVFVRNVNKTYNKNLCYLSLWVFDNIPCVNLVKTLGTCLLTGRNP